MGAKAPSKLKLRRPTYKCKSCPKKFLSTQALKTHLFCEHKLKRNRRTVTKKADSTPAPETVVQDSQNTSVPTISTKEVVGHVEIPIRLEETFSKSPKNSDLKKVSYSCSKCKQLFSNYFSVQKHVEKVHTKILQTTTSEIEYIKPELVESCLMCYNSIEANQPHSCASTVVDLAYFRVFLCTGCHQQFSSLQHFDTHIAGLHNDGIQSLFFPTYTEFNDWKEVMEKETMVKYSALSKNKFKQTYRCMFLPKVDDVSAVYFCPSSIMIREYSKGLQVHFYKQHHGHPFIEYRTPNRFKPYTLNESLLKPNIDFEMIDISDESDLYVQFRKLMNCIVIDSAKLNIEMLKVLISKAFEMTKILNSYDEESDTVPKAVNRSMTDDEIFRALHFFMRTQKYTPADFEIAQEKSVDISDTPKIVNTFSLAGQSVENAITSNITAEMNTRSLRKSARIKDESVKVVVPVKVTPPPLAAVNTLKTIGSQSIGSASNTSKTAQSLSIQDLNVSTSSKTVLTPSVTNTSICMTSKTVSTSTNSSGHGDPKPVSKPVSLRGSPRNVSLRVTAGNPNKTKRVSTPVPTKRALTPTTQLPATVLPTTADITPPDTSSKIDSKSSESTKNSTPLSQAVSFNDSYKDFVVKNFKVDANVKKPSRKLLNNDTNVPNVPDADNHVNKLLVEKLIVNKTKPTKRVLQDENVIADNGKLKGPRGARSKVLRKTLIRNLKKRPGKKKKLKSQTKKDIVKTKIGQFKPILSPKKKLNRSFGVSKTSSALRPSSSETKTAVDITYEVKEQDNDCNILILKI
ncbi:hypothetical protein ACJJTC_002732 [Scirpophaga incertulas]